MTSSLLSGIRKSLARQANYFRRSEKKSSFIPFFNPESANHGIDIVGTLERVLASKNFILGKNVSRFENHFAGFVGVRGCVGVGNGTDALEIALRTLSMGRDSRIAMVANAAFYGSSAAHSVGSTPVYVDVDPNTGCMDPSRLSSLLKEEKQKIDCILVTHLYGRMANMPDIMNLAEQSKIPVVEDCAQAHGAELNGRRAGSWGAIGTFSFYPTKNLGALGDGGAIVSNELDIIEKARSLRQYGWGEKYRIENAGGRNSRLDELQAAILVEKLKHLPSANSRRQWIAKAYKEAFSGLPLKILFPSDQSSVAHLFVISVQNRDQLAQDLMEWGVQTAVHYPFADHLQPAYDSQQKKGSLPHTEALAGSVLSLPCHPGIQDRSVAHIIEAVNACMSKQRRLPS